MDYTELKEAIHYFESNLMADPHNEYSYPSLRSRGDHYWLHLETMGAQRLGQEVIDRFLNHWNCRIPSGGSRNGPEVVANLKHAVDRLPEYYAALSRFTIEDVDFQGRTVLKGKEESIQNVIESIYSTFRQIKPKFGAVPASKLMHMAVPGLFVMWDDGIIEAYAIPKRKLPGFGRRLWSYTAFLMVMQENTWHVVRSHQWSSDRARRTVIEKIKADYNNLPIPRLLDMANFAVRDGKQLICKACMERAKNRWRNHL